MLGDFLSLFWNPLVKMLEDVKWIKKNKKDKFCRWNYNPIDVVLEVNKTQTYWLFFTPNGNYWDLSKIWFKAECQAAKPWHQPLWNCLFADIDLNNKKNPTNLPSKIELWKEIVDTINNYKIPPSFVVETPWWFHLYWMIHPEDRQIVQATLGSDIVKILKHITNLFLWWDDSALAVNKVMRMPFSNHRKTKEPLPVVLNKYNKETWELTPMTSKEDLDDIFYLRVNHLNTYLEYVKDEKKINSIWTTQKQFYSAEAYNTANSIPFPKLLEKLSKFPKLYKGKKYIFWIVDTSLTVSINWITELTWWYKRRRDQNYINCFSDSNHPIDERPRWDVMSFLYHYFSKDSAKVKSFLKNEFLIDVDDVPLEAETEEVVITKHDYSIIFTSRRVMLKNIVQWKNAQYERLVDLFKQPLTILGKWKTRMTYNLAETEDLNDVFLCESWWEKFFLRRHVSKKDFNTKNNVLFFYWEDNDLWMFYEALVYSENIQSLDILSQSGIYDDCVYVWGNIVYWETDKFLLPAFEFDMAFKSKEQVTIKDFIDWLCEIVDDYIAVPAVLQSIVLWWMNARGEKTVYPGMLLTWWTWSWKTVLSFMLKSMLWYNNTARTYSLGSLSPQPLKQYATDNSILFLEEITSNIQERCEEILRNVLNHNKGWRWTNTGTNVFYDFRSPIFALGERTFKDESINNRFLTLVMSSTQHKWDDEKIQAMQTVTCTDDIYSKYFDVKEELNDKYEEYADRLKKDWVHPRVADVWAYSYAINDLFQIWYTYDELYLFMQKNLKNIWYDLTSPIKIWKEHQLKSIIVNGIMNHRILWTHELHDDHETYTIMFMEDFYQKHRAVLNFMITQFNEDKQRMLMIGNDLVVSVSTQNADKVDFVLDNIFNFILKVWKNVFTNVYN